MSYEKKVWNYGDVIYPHDLNRIENAISDMEENTTAAISAIENKFWKNSTVTKTLCGVTIEQSGNVVTFNGTVNVPDDQPHSKHYDLSNELCEDYISDTSEWIVLSRKKYSINIIENSRDRITFAGDGFFNPSVIIGRKTFSVNQHYETVLSDANEIMSVYLIVSFDNSLNGTVFDNYSITIEVEPIEGDKRGGPYHIVPQFGYPMITDNDEIILFGDYYLVNMYGTIVETFQGGGIKKTIDISNLEDGKKYNVLWIVKNQGYDIKFVETTNIKPDDKTYVVGWLDTKHLEPGYTWLGVMHDYIKDEIYENKKTGSVYNGSDYEINFYTALKPGHYNICANIVGDSYSSQQPRQWAVSFVKVVVTYDDGTTVTTDTSSSLKGNLYFSPDRDGDRSTCSYVFDKPIVSIKITSSISAHADFSEITMYRQ